MFIKFIPDVVYYSKGQLISFNFRPHIFMLILKKSYGII